MPPMLLNHQAMSVPVGVWKSMTEDSVGLRVVGELTKGNPEAEQVYAAMKHGAMTGLSIGYRAVKYEENDKGGLDLHAIDLKEGSIVSMPAKDTARIDVVKYEEMFSDIESVKDFEYALRDVGCSQSVAKRLCSQFKSVCQRDVGILEDEILELKEKLAQFERIEKRKSRLGNLENLLIKDEK
jgi:HK97 family phage prohead protease